MLRANETLGQRIVRLRRTAGWKYQKDFANAIQIDPSSLNQIERDKRPPKRETVDKMARVLNVSRDLILDGERPGNQQPDAAPAPRQTPPPLRPPPLQEEAPQPREHGRTNSNRRESQQKGSGGSPPSALKSADIRAAIRAETTAILSDIAQALLNTVTARREKIVHGKTRVSRRDQAAGASNRGRGSR
jgi:transcriptional regulator with XRE-family HTH domain